MGKGHLHDEHARLTVVASIYWSIWREKNNRIFNNTYTQSVLAWGL